MSAKCKKMKQPIQKVDYLILPTKLRLIGGLKEPKKFFYI